MTVGISHGKIQLQLFVIDKRCENSLRVTPRGSRKKPKLGRSPTARRETAVVDSHVACRGLEESLGRRHTTGTACHV